MGDGRTHDREADGTVYFFNDTIGCGFIESPQVDVDVFFHMEDIGGPDLFEGQAVAFDVEHADKGPRATGLVRLESMDAVRSGTGQADPSRSALTGPSSTVETRVDGPSGGDTEVFEPGNDASGADRSAPCYCPYCGADLADYPDAVFCSACGENLS